MTITRVTGGYQITANGKVIMLNGLQMRDIYLFWQNVIYEEDYELLLDDDRDVVSDIANTTNRYEICHPDFKEEVMQKYIEAMEEVINNNWRETLEDCIYRTIREHDKER